LALSEGLLLDSHVWVWIANVTLHPDLSLVQKLNAAAATNSIYLSSMSLYEIANATLRGRINLFRPLEDWLTTNLRRPGPRLVEVTPAIVVETTKLPASFHGDPGDRLIAATARLMGFTLVAHDKALLRFGKHGLFAVLSARERRKVS
jgi:PIN domain nuclease of toxin-antitoxin system